jgi:adenosylcobinamide-phosphate synthase
MVSRSLAVVAGLAADAALREPPNSVHPVALYGKAMARVEDFVYADNRLAGMLHCAIGVGASAAAGGALRSTFASTYVALGGAELRSVARQVSSALDNGDLSRARELLPSLVGRDPRDLDEKEIARAVVESLAENTVDAVVAPVTWALVGGARGVLAHRALNTLDSMVGHRSARYGRFGWASARLDDLAAWVPARLTAALVAITRPRSAAEVLRVARSQASGHPSPNAGVAEGAFAAALGVRLGGTNRYGERTEVRPPLGDGRAPETRDIARALELSRDVTSALASFVLAGWAARRVAGAFGRSRAEA